MLTRGLHILASHAIARDYNGLREHVAVMLRGWRGTSIGLSG